MDDVADTKARERPKSGRSATANIEDASGTDSDFVQLDNSARSRFELTRRDDSVVELLMRMQPHLCHYKGSKSNASRSYAFHMMVSISRDSPM